MCRHTKPDGSIASVTFRQSADNVSSSRSLVYRRGDRFESFVSDVGGPGGDGELDSRRGLVRC